MGVVFTGPTPEQMRDFGLKHTARELAQRVAVLVGRLPEADREILLLRHAEQLSFDEISCLLDIEPATARKRFGRALIRLQKALVDEGLLEDRPRRRKR